MQDGIYHVRFSAPTGNSGEGLIVIKQGSVNGGDAGYLYSGKLDETAASLSVRLAIKRWNPSHISIFGSLDDFDLQLSGNSDVANGFKLSGAVATHPVFTISIVGRYLSAAA